MNAIVLRGIASSFAIFQLKIVSFIVISSLGWDIDITKDVQNVKYKCETYKVTLG